MTVLDKCAVTCPQVIGFPFGVCLGGCLES